MLRIELYGGAVVWPSTHHNTVPERIAHRDEASLFTLQQWQKTKHHPLFWTQTAYVHWIPAFTKNEMSTLATSKIAKCANTRQDKTRPGLTIGTITNSSSMLTVTKLSILVENTRGAPGRCVEAGSNHSHQSFRTVEAWSAYLCKHDAPKWDIEPQRATHTTV